MKSPFSILLSYVSLSFFLTCLSILLTAGAQADELDLAVWLTEHPRVSQAIAWEDSKGITTYPNWSASQKADLYRTFHKVWSAQSLGLTDPPPNMLQLADDGPAWIVLSEDHAWPLFLAHVSFSLAVETGQWVPWSLTEYSDEALSELFDGSKMFQWVDFFKGYEPPLRGIPAPPDVTFEFVNEYLMIGQSRLETIGNLLEWCRAKMHHYFGKFRAGNVYSHWQYRGGPPVSRVISGTIRGGSRSSRHWTAGCHGTTAFLRAVLRVVNIPVKNMIARRHSLPYFMTEGKYLSHGDDPYSATVSSSPGYPIEKLFIDQTTYDAWFGPSVPPEKSNVGRRTEDLAIKYLPLPMLKAHCRDFILGIPHANSQVYNNYLELYRFYTVEELESINFWNRMEAKIDALGGCPIKTLGRIALDPRTPTILKISGPVTSADNLLVVEVRDSEGRAIEDHLVTFSVTSGGGTLSAIRTTTDADGRAETRLTLGPDVGTNIVSAIAAGAVEPVTFVDKAMAMPDFDGDGIVGISDFLQFVEQFGFSQDDEGYDARFDLDGDGLIGIGDFLIFVNNFGKKVS